MKPLLAPLLAIAYGIAWAVSATSPNPEYALIGLAVAGTILALPKLLLGLGVGVAITSVIGFVVVLFPIAAPLVGIWGIIKIVGKVQKVVENFALIVAGCLLYGALLEVPSWWAYDVLAYEPLHRNAWALSAVVFATGAALMFGVLRLFEAKGKDQIKTAMFVFALPAFLVMLVLPFINMEDADIEDEEQYA